MRKVEIKKSFFILLLDFVSGQVSFLGAKVQKKSPQLGAFLKVL